MADAAIRVFDGLIEATVLLSRDLEREFARSGLSLARVHLLWQLHGAGPTTQRDLAAALAVSPRNITGLVDALESSGHVVRAPHPTDRRAVLVSLTGSGRRDMEAMAREHEKIAARLVEGLSARETAALADALATVNIRLRSMVDGVAGG